MGLLVAALEPNASILANSARCSLNSVVATNAPALLGVLATAGHQVANVLQHLLVSVADIAARHNNKVDVQRLLRSLLRRAESRRLITDVEAQRGLARAGELVNTRDRAVVPDALRPVLLGIVEDLLRVHLGVDLLEQLDAHDAVVGRLVAGDGLGADDGVLRPDVVDALRVEDLVDERRVVAGLERRAADDQVGFAGRVARVQVVEDFGGALAAADDGDGARCLAGREDLVDVRGVLRAVDDSGVGGGDFFGDAGAAAGGDHDVFAVCDGLTAGCAVGGSHFELLSSTSLRVGTADVDGGNVLAVFNDFFEVLSAPPHVVFILDALGKESAQVRERNEAVVLVKVVQEGELASGVSQRSHILDERDLHFSSGEEHASVPCELLLAFQETDLGSRGTKSSLALVDSIVESDCNRERRRSKANTY